MKFLFVWPNKDEFGWKPIGIALLSSILKSTGHKVELFDTTYIDCSMEDNTTRTEKARMHKQVDLGKKLIKQKLDLKDEFLRKVRSFQPDIVGISALSDEIEIGLRVSQYTKGWNPDTIVLWGNKLATMEPAKVLQHDFVDYACVGEGIRFIKAFMDCLEQDKDVRQINNIAYKDPTGKIHVNPLDPYFQHLDDLPYLDWTLFDSRHFVKPYDGRIYRGGDHMIFWGCPKHCTYCINASYRKLYGHGSGKFLRNFSVARIIDELKYLVSKWGITLFKFHDEDFCVKSVPYLSELSARYAAEVNVPFVVMANAKSITPQKVDLLKRMNCVSVSMGIETGNKHLRQTVLKRKESKEDIITAVKALNNAGIRTSSYNMIGLPFETRETIFETIQLNRDANVRYPAAQFFFPLEGTELREIAIKNHFFDPANHAVFRRDKPSLNFPNISEEELIALMDRFTLYIKLPEAFRTYIDRSLVRDDIGQALIKELYNIYDHCVLSNDGFWNENCDIDAMIAQLKKITG